MNEYVNILGTIHMCNMYMHNHAYTRIHVYKAFVYTYQEHEVLHSMKPLSILHIYMYTTYGVFFLAGPSLLLCRTVRTDWVH